MNSNYSMAQARAWLVFAVVALGLVSLLAIPEVAALLNGPLARLVARASAPLLALLGMEAAVAGATIQSGGFAGEIIAACTPVYPAILFTAAVVAFPSRWRAKLGGLLGGLALLLAVNQVRIVGLVAVGRAHPELFEMAHYLVGQALIVAATVGLWLAWALRWGDREAHHA